MVTSRSPKRLFATTALLVVVVLTLAACAQDPAANDVCARASRIFNECGASLPALAGTCSATKRAIATCITNNATSCEALAGLYEHLDVCVTGFLEDAGIANNGDDIEQAEIPALPITKNDAGKHPDAAAAASIKDAGSNDDEDGDGNDAAPAKRNR